MCLKLNRRRHALDLVSPDSPRPEKGYEIACTHIHKRDTGTEHGANRLEELVGPVTTFVCAFCPLVLGCKDRTFFVLGPTAAFTVHSLIIHHPVESSPVRQKVSDRKYWHGAVDLLEKTTSINSETPSFSP
jgi:hypothetical protein